MSFTARFINKKDVKKKKKTGGIFNNPREGDKFGLEKITVNEKQITFFGITQV